MEEETADPGKKTSRFFDFRRILVLNPQAHHGFQDYKNPAPAPVKEANAGSFLYAISYSC